MLTGGCYYKEKELKFLIRHHFDRNKLIYEAQIFRLNNINRELFLHRSLLLIFNLFKYFQIFNRVCFSVCRLTFVSQTFFRKIINVFTVHT